MLASPTPVITSDRTFTRVARQRKVLGDDPLQKNVETSGVLSGIKQHNVTSSTPKKRVISSTSDTIVDLYPTSSTTTTTTTKSESSKEDAVMTSMADDVLEEFCGEKTKERQEEMDDEEAFVTSVDEEDQTKEKGNVYYEQFNERGMLTTEPIPKGCVPNMDRPEPIYAAGFPEEMLEITKEAFGLDTLDLSEDNMKARNVPIKWVNEVGGALSYIITAKWKPGIDSYEDLPQTFISVFATFFLDVYDEHKGLINWKTVACVAHLVRLLPSTECYHIKDDLFSHSFGIKEYDLDNWKIKTAHELRMAAVSQISGDTLNAVCTLDMLMRFRRFVPLQHMCVTSTEKATLNESFQFVSYLKENGKLGYAWIECGLTKQSVLKLQKEQADGIAMGKEDGSKGYYDGPFCSGCNRHHMLKPLIYCKKCRSTAYCSGKCVKKDRVHHNKICVSCKLDDVQ